MILTSTTNLNLMQKQITKFLIFRTQVVIKYSTNYYGSHTEVSKCNF